MTTDLEQREAVVAREQIAANLRAWITDLRTTDAKQGVGRMHRERQGVHEFCATGRGCEATGLPWVESGECLGGTYYFPVIDGEPHGNYGRIDALFGLVDDDGYHVRHMNDRGKTFAEIADWLEAKILPRYVEMLLPAEG